MKHYERNIKMMNTELNRMNTEELAMIVGGREIRSSEWNKTLELKARLNYQMSLLSSEERYDAITELRNRYNEAFYKWKNAIADASEDSADISISQYFHY